MINFTKDECKKIISLQNVFKKHTSDEWWESDETKYFAWHLERNEITEWIFERLLNFISTNTNIILKKPFNLIHLQNVKTGNKFEPHIDKHSVRNVGVCLNDDYEGGELICHDPEVILPKVVGNIYTFYGSRLHEVTQVTMGERWSLIAFLDKDLMENKLI
jgi:hypothetical protein